MVRCEDCEWTGSWQDCSISWKSNSVESTIGSEPAAEVELVDCCPECGSIKLIEIDDRLVPA